MACTGKLEFPNFNQAIENLNFELCCGGSFDAFVIVDTFENYIACIDTAPKIHTHIF